MINLLLLDNSYLGFFWLVVGLIFLFVELATPGLFLFVAFALGSIFSAVFAFLNYSFMIQCIIFVVGFVISFLLLRYSLKKKKMKSVITNVDALKGKNGVVVKKIEEHGKGLVKVGGEIWTAVGVDGRDFEKDSLVNVFIVDGSKLIVK
jgi:membrane protein implicated in regulation of membrane protease activity